jgi:hypothetical protein
MTNGTLSYVKCEILALVLALSATGSVLAQEHGHDFGGHEGFAHHHFDGRFGHDRYYFDRGYAVHHLPHSGYAIDYDHDHYWYDGGDWYHRRGSGWMIVGAPVGAFVPFLPPLYTTVWLGGIPYYYANDTYYSWNGDRQAYEVVEPPSGIESAGTTQPPPSDKIFIYPKNGQSSQQEERDRYDCHHSAVEQTGYDTTKPDGGVAPEIAASKRADYFRAMTACLEARGYSVD